MEYCKYHPLKPASYTCQDCQTRHCDLCVDEGKNGDTATCFICNNETESLGAIYSAEPFWRRFQESFRYPLHTGTIIFIIAIAFINTIIPYLPFAIIFFLIVTGVFMKYCFSCLEKTAKGALLPPDITTAYDGGIILALKLIAILFIMGLSVVGIQLWLGTAAATLFGVALLCCCPAIIINFSLSESIIDAINPIKILYLISAVGLPYGLLLAIILVMLGSVGFINQFFGDNYSIISLGIQSSISNYYTIVIFHLMGYMLFQYQGQLGFIARQEDEENEARSNADRSLAKIDVHVKEGLYDEALVLFQAALKTHIKNKALHKHCLDFLLATKNKELINDFSPLYFDFLVKNQAKDQLSFTYKKILQVYPSFMPITAENKYLLAQECHASGDSVSVIRLLKGIHKQFPNYGKLIPALDLMVEALRDLPNMKEKADSFELVVRRFKKQKEQEAKTAKRQTKAKMSQNPIESLSLEDQIKQNAEINSSIQTSAPPRMSKSPTIPKTDSQPDIDYDGGIDFNA